MDKLYIPKKLNVGFQKRNDTYTGKLGYVIYWDDKNKLRKETSWSGWRDKEIDTLVCDNEPIEGFVLNREVGGVRHSWNWNARREKIRVYDPRNFEFEITIENMLYILAECTSSKGKGLEGKFVYAWSGPELVLLPEGTLEYKSCTNFTDLQAMKVGKAEMVPGCSYTFKDTNSYIYLGKMNYYTDEHLKITNPNYNPSRGYSYNNDGIDYRSKEIWTHYQKSSKPLHIFYSINKQGNAEYRTESGFTKVATRDTQIHDPNLAELVVEFQSSRYGGKCVSIEIVDAELDFSPENIDQNQWRGDITLKDNYYIIQDGKILDYPIEEKHESEYDSKLEKYVSKKVLGYLPLKHLSYNTYWMDENNMLCHKHKYGESYYGYHNSQNLKYLTREDLKLLQFKKVYAVLENGTKIDIKQY